MSGGSAAIELARSAAARGFDGPLVDELGSANHSRRALGCADLGVLLRAGREAALDVLVEALGDSHPSVRVAAAEAVSGAPVAAETALLEALRGLEREGRPGHRASLVHALGLLERPAEGALAEALLLETRNGDHDVRFQALVSLNALGCRLEAYRDLLPGLLRDADDEVAAVAATAAADFELRDSVDDVVARWRTARGFAKRHLALAAGHLGSDAVIDSLITAMRDGFDALGAIEALVSLASEPACDALYKAARSWRVHPLVRARAAVALLEVGHAEGPALVEKQASHRRNDVRWATLDWLGRTGRLEWRGLLEQRLQDPRSDDSSVAAFALGLLGDPSAQDALRSAVATDRRDDVREEARIALEHLGTSGEPLFGEERPA